MKIGKIITGGMFVGLVLASNIIAISAKATPLTPDWMNGDIILRKSDRIYSTSGCTNEIRQIKTQKDYYYQAADYAPKSWCIYHYNSFDVAFYDRQYMPSPWAQGDTGYQESGMAISFHGDRTLTPVDNMSSWYASHIVYVSNSDSPYFTVDCVWNGGCQLIAYDFINNISWDDKRENYAYSPGSTWVLKYQNGQPILVAGPHASENGEWMSFVIRNVGLVRMNMHSFELELLSSGYYYRLPEYVIYEPFTDITNDGESVVVIGTESLVMSTITKYSQGCSRRIDTIEDTSIYISNLATCSFRELNSTLAQIPNKPNVTNNTFSHVDLSGQGNRLSFYADYSNWYEMYPYNSQDFSKISYLALGDSYSSGEGDIDQTGSTHYLPYTNVFGDYSAGMPRELCHLSDRSYPLLLATDMQLSRGNNMQSIACAGAVRNDVLTEGTKTQIRNLSYFGQTTPLFDSSFGKSYSAPRLSGLSNITALQDQAVLDFIPGRVQQIEMVRKYQPKVATIGISGNDIGFGGILFNCMTNLVGNCTSAEPEGLSDLGNSIKDNYKDQADFYAALKEASPSTDFYAIGYPQLIDDTKVFCIEVAGALTANERTMIRESVTYLNQTIKNAAAKAGIKYIDIEDVVTGQQQDLCASSGMITGATDKFYYGGLTAMYRDFQSTPTKGNGSFLEQYILTGAVKNLAATIASPMTSLALLMQEAFHPNAEGHKAIYDYIHAHQDGDSLLDDECDGVVIICPSMANSSEPSLPAYFGSADDTHVNFTSLLTNSGKYLRTGVLTLAERGKEYEVKLASSIYTTGTQLRIEVHSDPTLLATTAAGTNGEVRASVTVPTDLPIGYHEILVTGIGPGSQEAKYVESIFVTGPSDDIDGDGVLNSVDKCEFISPSGVDTDSDEIDDACDLSVGLRPRSSPTETYTIRAMGVGGQVKTQDDQWPNLPKTDDGGFGERLTQKAFDVSRTKDSISNSDSSTVVLMFVLILLSFSGLVAYAVMRKKE